MIEEGQDLRKQIFKLQVQRNKLLHKNQSLNINDHPHLNQTSDDSNKQKDAQDNILNQNGDNKSSSNLLHDQEGLNRMIRQKVKSMTIQTARTLKLEEDLSQEKEQKQISFGQVYRQSSFQRQDSVFDENLFQDQMYNSHGQDFDHVPSKYQKKDRSKVLQLMNQGVIKQFSEQPSQTFVDKEEIIKKIRTILAKDQKERDETDLNFLQDCYGERIDFFKVISGRYGLSALKNVFKVMKYETFQKGDKIFQIGDKGDKFYIILSGKVKVTIPKKQIQDAQANLQALSRISSFMNPQISPKRQSMMSSPKNQLKKNSQLISINSISEPFQKILNQSNSFRGKKSSQIFIKMSEFQQNSIAIQKRRLSKLLLDQRSSLQNTNQESYDPKDYLEELSNKYNIVRELGKGESFGEMSMQIKQNNQRNTTVFADEKCELAVISRNDYMEIITPFQQGDAEEKLDFLQNIPYFQNWDKKDLRILSYSLELQQVPKGSFLYKEEDNSNYLYMIQHGEFKITKQCQSKISEVQDVEHSKLVTMKENLLICVCHQFEILGEESVLGLKKRDFSIQASTLDSQVYRISHYDLENVYKNLTNNREDNYFNLLESLIQKREWKLDRFSELFNKFLKERKLMHSNTINYARLTSIHSSSQRKIALSQGASPNNLKLKAIQNQYSAKLNFTNAFQSLGEYTKQAEEDQVQETSKFRSYSQSIGQKSSSRQQSQRQIKASHRSQTSSSSSEDNNNEDQQSINQFTAKPNNEYEANDGSNKCIEQYDQSQNQNSSIIQKLFDPDSYYKKLQLKIKKANDIKQTKYQPQKLDHNKILNLDYTPQSSRKENQNQDSNKSPKIKQFNKYSLSPFNNGFKQDQQKNQQQYQLKLNQQNPNFKSQTGKMKLSEEDEKALEDYYKLKILPISVVFSKADESNQKRISSSNDQMLQRLKLLGIETPKKSQLNKTQDDVSPKKAFKIRKSESTGQLHNQNLNSPAHSKESDRQNNRQSSVLKASQFQQKQNQRASLDQNSFIQIIREKNGSISEQKINPGNTPKLNNSTLSIIKEQYNQNDEGMSKTQQNINENMKLQGEVGNLLKKEKEEQEQYKKQKQFIDTMKSYADVYKLVEMNYLESHSIKAHQLMKETMDDMNLIRKFAQQTYKKNTNSIVTNFAKQEFQKKLMKKQKQEKFEKLKKRGLINENEVNMDDSIELNQHLKKIADLQQQIYDNINDPTGSRSNNYNFGGLKKRKVGVQLSDQINLFQQMPAFQQSIPQTNESITEESLSNISQVQINENPSKNAISNIIDNQKKDENLIKNESNQNQKQQILQKKTMGVLAMMQKQYKQSIDQPIQKNLEIFNLKNKFQKSAQLRLFKQLKQEEQNSNNKGLSIFNTLGQINKKNEIKDKINKFEPQKSMEAFVQRGFQRQSNTQYLSNLFFGQISHSKDHKEPNDTHSKLPKNGLFSNQSIGSLNQNQTNTTLKPYQHINNIKPSEFSQFNSVWDNSKKQLQFQRILNYNR